MTDTTKGFFAMVAACCVWGLSGIYYKALSEVPPLEVLAHRTLWSVLFLGAVVAVQGQRAVLAQALRGRSLRVLAAAAVVISLNWFGFIWSVQNGRAVEASLGYYIFPLVAVALGMVFYGERMGRAQAVAVMIAAAAVGWLTWALGAAPWIALMLATTFGLYGLLKKGLSVPPVVSVLAEVVLLAPLAVLLLAAAHFGWVGLAPGSGRFGSDFGSSLMLAFSGLMTGGPLMLFSYAAQRVRMATIGLVQYLNPTLQFGVAVAVFAEPFTRAHAIAFALIWGALALYSAAALRARG